METLAPLAVELNDRLKKSHPGIFDLLSDYGKRLYFPKGIISQSQEAKEKAHLYDATIGIAKESGMAMMLPGFEDYVGDKIEPHSILPYAPSGGLQALRTLWAERQKRLSPQLKGASLPLVTSGLTQGLSLAGELFIDEGDAVISPDLMWGNYKLMWQLRGKGKLITFPLFEKNLKSFNLSGLEEVLTSVEGSKIFLSLNFPNNPTGYSLTKEEASSLLLIVKKVAKAGKKIVALCDDAYWGLVYEKGIQKESLFTGLADLHENVLAVKIDGSTKEFFMWGQRVGFMTFGAKGMDSSAYFSLERKAAAALRASTSSVTHQSQEILRQILLKEDVEEQAGSKYKVLEDRYKVVKNEVYKSDYKDCWDVYPFNSGYFMCLRLKNNLDSEKFRIYLLDEYKIGVIGLGGSDIRVAFSCVEKEFIPDLFKKMAHAVRDIA